VVAPQPRAVGCLPEMPDIGKRKTRAPHKLTAFPPPPSLDSSSAICERCSSRSHCLFLLPPAATGGPAVLPTSVVARKSRIALLQRSSANSSAILVRSLVRTGPGCGGHWLAKSKPNTSPEVGGGCCHRAQPSGQTGLG